MVAAIGRRAVKEVSAIVCFVVHGSVRTSDFSACNAILDDSESKMGAEALLFLDRNKQNFRRFKYR